MDNGNDSYLPVSGNVLPRYAGIATFMRLRHIPVDDAEHVQIGLVGVPGTVAQLTDRARVTGRGK